MAHKHAEAMMMYAEDALTTDKPYLLWEFTNPDWHKHWMPCLEHPHWSENTQYRHKQKRIDMSIFIEFGLDCCFSQDTTDLFWEIKTLRTIKEQSQYYVAHDSIQYKHCRPRFNYWFCWNGGDKAPIPEGFIIEVRLRDDTIGGFDEYHHLRWTRTGKKDDIIAFRIVDVLDGWCL